MPNTFQELIEFYDKWIKEHNIVDEEEKRKIWWAMFYCWKEKGEWIET